ncbi:phenylacetate--CoA ligase [Anaerosphaera multitolerans]|uniref:Phenylacetate-coenzyme A ligase n=1 Tax=Anaerosphaera multitolerans TaxID=2487351 RepID=A0A437S5D9_9FIRM|nr:phenylacetate--CoA ligase [Anaerosphaera multitolerans]
MWAREERLSREDIKAIQSQRLTKQVYKAYNSVEAYREKMDEMGVKPEDIKSVDDISKLPFTTKSDFRENYPFGLFAVERDELLRIHASSGTTGQPTVVGYTQKDLDNWTETVSRVAVAGGASKGDIAQICFGYGMFTGALGLHYGLENIGATVIPSSVGNTKKQIMYMKDFGATLLVATPSYALHLGEVIRSMGMDPIKDLKVRIGLFGGENFSSLMREEIKSIWGSEMLCTSNYGMSELNGPGVSGECYVGNGLHINEDHYYAEIIDPESGEVLPEGESGELVITCLTKESIPLIRYRTRDLTRLFYEPCKCGRTTARMENLSGRSDDMLVIRGVNLFPNQVEVVINEFSELGAHYEMVIDRKNYLDHLEIKVELIDSDILDSYPKLENLEKNIKNKLKSTTGLDANIKLVAPRTLRRFEGKAQRVTDLRI